MDLNARADEVKQARDDIDLNVEVVEGSDQVEGALVGVVREGNDHALDVEAAHDRFQLVRRADERQLLESRKLSLRLIVDEADEAAIRN